MANPEHLAKLKEGVAAWDRWRLDHSAKEGVKEWNRWRLWDDLAINPDLSGADIREANLSGANLGRANLSGANLREANLSGANLERANLSGANLGRANINRADLREAELDGANLSAALLNWADLRRAKLDGANLSRANVSVVDLGGASLCRANLFGAHLGGSSLTEADLSGSDLTGGILGLTSFGDTDLNGAVGLDSCKHEGPSYLDYFTLAKSWPLPLSFLRGCGLPDAYIEYLPSLLNQAVQFYSCFISYSTEDQAFADRLYADLQNKGVRCWFAPHDIQGGKKIHEQLEDAIRMYDRLLLILSEHSMSSEWVKTEIAHARQKEVANGKRVLFPIGLAQFEAVKTWKCPDGDTGEDVARKIREYHIPDFSNWKEHDSYHEAFERLVRDLKSQG
jgi:hypothetical protein